MEETGASLKVVAWPDDNDWTVAVLNSLTADVAIAALPHVQWTSGGRLDLVRIGEACRKLGAALVLDLTQSLGALPFSVGGLQNDVQPDFAVAASYKWLLGPYSVGLLYVAPKWQDGIPLEENWIQRANARDFSSLILYTEDYDAGARRFDMGERSNFALLPAAVCAMKQLLEWKIEQISETAGSAQPSTRKRRCRNSDSPFRQKICAPLITSACEEKPASRENSPRCSRAKKSSSAFAALPSA